MSKNIEVKEAIMDSTSNFNIKRFKFGNLDIERPTKIIDAKKTNKNLFENEKKHFKKIIFEASKIVTTDSITTLVNETDNSKIRKWFGLGEWVSKAYPHTITQTFDFNPYDKYKNLEELAGYFSYYYNFSDTVLLVPNIKIEKYEYSIDSKTGEQKPSKKEIMTIDTYLKFVNETYQILDHKNSKKIFVPLSLRFNMSNIEKLAKDYIKNDYFNIWIDFEGSPTALQAKKARVQRFLDEIEKQERIKQIIIYATNIKREITSNPLSNESPSSDILTSVIGANLIGVNRERRGFKGKIPTDLPLEEQQKWKEEQKKKNLEIREHKARIFIPKSYYYLKVKDAKLKKEDINKLMNPSNNILHNSKLLDIEFKSQTDYFLKKGKKSIKEYISNKQMIKQYDNGSLAKSLFKEPKTKKSWF